MSSRTSGRPRTFSGSLLCHLINSVSNEHYVRVSALHGIPAYPLCFLFHFGQTTWLPLGCHFNSDFAPTFLLRLAHVGFFHPKEAVCLLRLPLVDSRTALSRFHFEDTDLIARSPFTPWLALHGASSHSRLSFYSDGEIPSRASLLEHWFLMKKSFTFRLIRNLIQPSSTCFPMDFLFKSFLAWEEDWSGWKAPILSQRDW